MTTDTDHDILEHFQAWAEGDIDAATALRGFADELRAIDAVTEPLEVRRATVRRLCEEIVQQAGEKIVVSGYGEFAFAPASVSQTYDRKQLETLLHDLIASGEGDWAQRLEACRKETMRAGGLRIIKEREAR